jgi:hypothetical protein
VFGGCLAEYTANDKLSAGMAFSLRCKRGQILRETGMRAKALEDWSSLL